MHHAFFQKCLIVLMLCERKRVGKPGRPSAEVASSSRKTGKTLMQMCDAKGAAGGGGRAGLNISYTKGGRGGLCPHSFKMLKKKKILPPGGFACNYELSQYSSRRLSPDVLRQWHSKRSSPSDGCTLQDGDLRRCCGRHQKNDARNWFISAEVEP